MKILNRKSIRPYITLDKSSIRELVSHRNSSIKGLSIAEAVVLPEKETSLHIHKTSQEVYFILSGKGRMQIGKQSKIVKRSDTIVILPKQKHRIRNIGKSNLIFLCICAPCYEHKDTKIL
ncbi:cupin domain-containing protein [Thermoproteota archaeon]